MIIPSARSCDSHGIPDGKTALSKGAQASYTPPSLSGSAGRRSCGGRRNGLDTFCPRGYQAAIASKKNLSVQPSSAACWICGKPALPSLLGRGMELTGTSGYWVGHSSGGFAVGLIWDREPGSRSAPGDTPPWGAPPHAADRPLRRVVRRSASRAAAPHSQRHYTTLNPQIVVFTPSLHGSKLLLSTNFVFFPIRSGEAMDAALRDSPARSQRNASNTPLTSHLSLSTARSRSRRLSSAATRLSIKELCRSARTNRRRGRPR